MRAIVVVGRYFGRFGEKAKIVGVSTVGEGSESFQSGSAVEHCFEGKSQMGSGRGR